MYGKVASGLLFLFENETNSPCIAQRFRSVKEPDNMRSHDYLKWGKYKNARAIIQAIDKPPLHYNTELAKCIHSQWWFQDTSQPSSTFAFAAALGGKHLAISAILACSACEQI